MSKYSNENKHLSISVLMTMLFIGIIYPGLIYASQSSQSKRIVADKISNNYKVTFIELGSVRCIPCQQMQVVMKNIENKYGKQVKIIFHDVWTTEGKPFIEVYKIRVIPTQVFLDDKGKEFFRHEGYFPEEELVNILKIKGVN